MSISLPCIAGPYTSVSAKLSLVNNRYRKNTNPDNAASTGYAKTRAMTNDLFIMSELFNPLPQATPKTTAAYLN